jgi:hypothetical protein
MIALVAWIMPSFRLEGPGAAILASIIVGLTGWLANSYVGDAGRVEVWSTRRKD